MSTWFNNEESWRSLYRHGCIMKRCTYTYIYIYICIYTLFGIYTSIYRGRDIQSFVRRVVAVLLILLCPSVQSSLSSFVHPSVRPVIVVLYPSVLSSVPSARIAFSQRRHHIWHSNDIRNRPCGAKDIEVPVRLSSPKPLVEPTAAQEPTHSAQSSK